MDPDDRRHARLPILEGIREKVLEQQSDVCKIAPDRGKASRDGDLCSQLFNLLLQIRRGPCDRTRQIDGSLGPAFPAELRIRQQVADENSQSLRAAGNVLDVTFLILCENRV